MTSSSSSALRPHTPNPTSILKQPRSSSYPTSSSTSSLAQPHPLLGSHQLVEYDLRDHPTAITYRAFPLSTTTLSEPATTPPIAYLSLKCVYLPRQIKVYASSNGAYITLNDLFCTLYNTLRTNLTEADFYAIFGER